jgi:hypothetical protein
MVITGEKPGNPSGNYQKRRLSDTILIAFHHACDQADVAVAAELLDVLGFMINRMPDLPTGVERRAKESLVAAYERLWQIRHPTSLTR